MRSKAPLVMMEQIIMVLIFALASALCVQMFVLAENLSKRTEAQNRAVVEVQNAAESIKAKGLEAYVQEKEAEQIKDGFMLFFDASWNRVSEQEQAVYHIKICPYNSDSEYVWSMDIVATEKDGEELFRVPVAGQKEVAAHE